MFIILLLFWILLLGDITPEIIAFGAAVSALVYLFLYKIFGVTPSKELRHISLVWYIPAYAAVLLAEIVKANTSVIKKLLTGSRDPAAVIVRRRFPVETDFGRALLADSITITPGTITVSADGDVFTVHCLDKSFADGLDGWIVCRLICRMERSFRRDA